jgi:hypothetical protein
MFLLFGRQSRNRILAQHYKHGISFNFNGHNILQLTYLDFVRLA